MDVPLEVATVPTAGARRRRRIPLVWIVPLLTALIAAWLAWDTYSKRGPTITVSFEAAAGLQAGQSQLKFKDVVMGTVKTIVVTPDFSKVLVTVETTREAEGLLSDKTIFWIVKPQLFAGNLSGLDTLLSGSYIGMLPSAVKGKPERHFVGSPDPPILTAAVPGTTFSWSPEARRDQPGIADLLPRTRRRHRARLGPRRYGPSRHRSCFRAGAVRQVRA